jgi:HEAT repeat protein
MTSPDATIRAALDYFTGPLALASSPDARELATHQILALGDTAYPVVVDVARREGRRFPGVLELVARFGRPDSVPLLAEVLGDGSQEATWAAGQALGIHPAPEARQVLVDGLRSERPDTVLAARAGLQRRAGMGESG